MRMNEKRSQARRLNIALFGIDKVYFALEQKKLMKESEMCLMYALDDGQPHSQRQISEEWLIPKTTINTIVKQWEREGLLILTAIPGKRREKQISLTEAGQAAAREYLNYIYKAEEKALTKTAERYSLDFIEALEYFGNALKEEMEAAEFAGETKGD